MNVPATTILGTLMATTLMLACCGKKVSEVIIVDEIGADSILLDAPDRFFHGNRIFGTH